MKNRFLDLLYYEFKETPKESIKELHNLITIVKKSEYYDIINKLSKEKQLEIYFLLFCKLYDTNLYNDVVNKIENLCVYQTITFYDEREYSLCSECGGAGSVDCDECDNGGVECPTCQGTGEFDDDECYECGGVGYVNCHSCDGRGILECNTCEGVKKIELDEPLIMGEVGEYVTVDTSLIQKIEEKYDTMETIDYTEYDIDIFRTNYLYFNDTDDLYNNIPIHNLEYVDKSFINRPCYMYLVSMKNMLGPNKRFQD